MKGGHISVGKIMTVAASGNDLRLVPLPRLMLMDIGVTIKAPDFIEHVHAAVVLVCLFFMTAHTLYIAGHLLAICMPFQVGNFKMAAGTAVLTMDRLRKFLHRRNFVVTLEAFYGVYGDAICQNSTRCQQQERQYHPSITPHNHDDSSIFLLMSA
jgi:hypothetical protein